ncbi:MAG: RagB/SusD family nutrient uptake outer membrane protein, partial [Bacteroidales bacterium]|nr:RagB/SusD family nutrient uptake outer membrane protein [Bacteroidales bacterium]
MKKYIAISLIALGALSAASCSKFLDVQSQGYPTQDQYFQNDQQAIDAVDGIYARLAQESCMG